MSLAIFKFINLDETKIITSFINHQKNNVTIKLFIDNTEIKKTITKKDSHIFNVDKKGDYHVELMCHTDDDEAYILTSNVIRISKLSKLSKGKSHDSGNPFKKNKNEKIEGSINTFWKLKYLKFFQR